MNIGVIIQARTTSTRLPEKVLLHLPKANKTVLECVIDRASNSEFLTHTIVATSTDEADDLIATLCESIDVPCFRGQLDDVLSRYYYAAKKYNLDIVVRITSDCPLIDGAVIDSVIEQHIKEGNDYTSNVLQRTYPHGMDTEVISFSALEDAYINATESFEREHVTPYINKTHADKFKIGHKLLYDDYSNIRVTLDNKEDYTLLSLVYDFLYDEEEYFTNGDVINLFLEKPYLVAINASVTQKKVYDSLKEELEASVKVLRLQELNRAADFIVRSIDEGDYSNGGQ